MFQQSSQSQLRPIPPRPKLVEQAETMPKFDREFARILQKADTPVRFDNWLKSVNVLDVWSLSLMATKEEDVDAKIIDATQIVDFQIIEKINIKISEGLEDS